METELREMKHSVNYVKYQDHQIFAHMRFLSAIIKASARAQALFTIENDDQLEQEESAQGEDENDDSID